MQSVLKLLYMRRYSFHFLYTYSHKNVRDFVAIMQRDLQFRDV